MPRRIRVLSELSRLVPFHTNSPQNLQRRCSPAVLPKGTFGKVQQHKTQHQMLLSFTNTAGSRKRQFSTFIHELVRAECGKARTSVPFCLVSAPAAFVFTINLRETRSLWPSQFASHYSSGVIWHCCIHLLTYTVNTLCINCLHAAVELIFYLPTPSFHSTMFLASVFTGTGLEFVLTPQKTIQHAKSEVKPFVCLGAVGVGSFFAASVSWIGSISGQHLVSKALLAWATTQLDAERLNETAGCTTTFFLWKMQHDGKVSQLFLEEVFQTRGFWDVNLSMETGAFCPKGKQ